MDMETVVKWDKQGLLHFIAVSESGNIVEMDNVKAADGDEQGFSLKQLLLVALGG
jgi:hypothetical protein